MYLAVTMYLVVTVTSVVAVNPAAGMNHSVAAKPVMVEILSPEDLPLSRRLYYQPYRLTVN